MFTDESRERSTTAQVDRGLYLLRYVSGPAVGIAPSAIIRPGAGFEPYIDVISAPGCLQGVLAGPGECLVIRAQRPGELRVVVVKNDLASTFEATLRLEMVCAAEAPEVGAAQLEKAFSAGPVGSAAGSFHLRAHVARRGDIEVLPAQWVAGPGAPAAIEGVEIVGPLPPGLGVEVQALVATFPPRWLDWVSAGNFTGSRGRAVPLAGLRFRLVGRAAAQFTLSADALFLGSPVLSRQGRELELVGSGVGDPLVGLRTELRRVPATSEPVATTPAIIAADPAMERRMEPRVRVFRASSSLQQMSA